MLEAYFDESSDEKQERFYTMAGFVSDVGTWNRLWGAWDRCLVYNKLTEFKASDCAGRRGEFEGKGDFSEAIYLDFLKIVLRGHSIVDKPMLVGHAGTISIPHWTEEHPQWRLRPSEDPYYRAFRHCIEGLCTDPEIASLPPDVKIRFVFDNHDKHRSAATIQYVRMLHDENLPWGARCDSGCHFYDSKQVKPLQAADMMAYEHCRARLDSANGVNPLRLGFRALAGEYGAGWDWGPANHNPWKIEKVAIS